LFGWEGRCAWNGVGDGLWVWFVRYDRRFEVTCLSGGQEAELLRRSIWRARANRQRLVVDILSMVLGLLK